jgi:hypothetical protein
MVIPILKVNISEDNAIPTSGINHVQVESGATGALIGQSIIFVSKFKPTSDGGYEQRFVTTHFFIVA